MTSVPDFLLLLGLGFIAGTIDSLVGGGGLITLPALAIVFGPNITAIATNKLAGVTAAATAWFIYRRQRGRTPTLSGNTRPFAFRFAGCVALGAVCGTGLAPYVSPLLFRGLLLVTAPVLLWIIFHRETWVRLMAEHTHVLTTTTPWIWIAAFFCGVYDGAWGPGGGTFLFLIMLGIARLPLLLALEISKFANMASAGFGLLSFSLQGYVVWSQGLWLIIAVASGAFFGSHVASPYAKKIIRPLLLVVVILLVLRVFWSPLQAH